MGRGVGRSSFAFAAPRLPEIVKNSFRREILNLGALSGASARHADQMKDDQLPLWIAVIMNGEGWAVGLWGWFGG